MLSFVTLASGSAGNALLVSGGGTHILIDAGISCRRITTSLRELGVDPGALSAVLITHEHTDHVAGLATLTRQLGLPVYTAAGTGRALCRSNPQLEDHLHTFSAGAGLQIGALWCRSFSTCHDAADSVGYTITLEGCTLAVATDLGHLTSEVLQAVLGAQAVVAEANHDEDWLREGPYPYYLKQRILSDRGHLSNEAGAELAARAVEAGARTVVLAHLSAENNTPARAMDAARQRLLQSGVDPERDIALSVAPQKGPGPVFHVVDGASLGALERRAALC